MAQTHSVKIKRRDDLIPPAIALKFRQINTVNGQPLVLVTTDLASTVGNAVYEGIGQNGTLQLPADFLASNSTHIASGTQATMQANSRAPAAVTATIDMEGFQELTATIGCVPVDIGDPATDGSAATFFNILFPELIGVANLALYDASGLPVTVTDDTGADVTSQIGTYAYALTKGQIAAWMAAPDLSGAVAKKVTINAKFTYDQQNTEGGTSVVTSKSAWHEHTWTGILTNLPAGTYGFQTPGEIVPYGLAGYMYAIASIPQYEGTFTIQEQEITDQCPMGSVLNLTGSRAEWATMRAPVQRISYDLTSGRTTLSFGPAGHLGPKDFVERLRVNRPPRNYYLNGGNITNAPGAATQLGGWTNEHGPSKNNSVPSLQVHPRDIADWIGITEITPGSYADGVPGVTIDSIGTNSYSGGGIGGVSGSPLNPTVHLAYGTVGVVQTFVHMNASGTFHMEDDTSSPARIIRASIEDLVTAGFNWSYCPITFYEVPICVSGTTYYVQVLCSKKYLTSVGNSP